MRTLFALLAAAALAGCNSPPTREPTDVEGPAAALVEIRLGEPFTLAPGAVATLPSADLSVRFIEVSSDSRCPVDVTCVWEGDAGVAVETARDGREDVWALHTPTEALGPAAAELDGYVLRLLGLEPAPHSERRTAPGDYRATLRVDRGGS
ncbi:MAG TPA: hypothetical protein VMM12_15310 [Longimicrobiales bacterium]|nr:hypothetical protein [Longimicrobiales bacterium]